jgi:hypothetical protein
LTGDLIVLDPSPPSSYQTPCVHQVRTPEFHQQMVLDVIDLFDHLLSSRFLSLFLLVELEQLDASLQLPSPPLHSRYLWCLVMHCLQLHQHHHMQGASQDV